MTEWKLFDGDNPRQSSVGFFRDNPWVPPENQVGHAERTAMVAAMIRDIVTDYHPATISDLGCGDGSLMGAISDLPVRIWGYDAGVQNVDRALYKGLDARRGDILSPDLEFGELLTCCEVVEHLARPHEFVRELPGRLLVLTSPSAETGIWHYADHTWAWDLEGYAALVQGAGWRVMQHAECEGGVTWHCNAPGMQRFQAVFAVRDT